MFNGVGDFLDLELLWNDETRYGSVLSARLQNTVRRQLYPRTWARLSLEMEKPPEDRSRSSANVVAELIREDRRSSAHRQITGDLAFWRPNPDLVRIDGFDIASEEWGTRTRVPATTIACDALRDWLRTGATDIPALLVLSRALEEKIGATGFSRLALPTGRGPLMIGHACVTWSEGGVRLWIDPFIRPKRLRYPVGQQPFSPLDASEPRQVVLITHCHPDHFNPASLLLFPSETTIVTPFVAYETPLAFDMARRARELGFTDVHTLRPGERLECGEFRITACPFYGEQPLGVHAEPGERRDRNEGVTYHVAGPDGITALFLADAGSDPTGSSIDLARHIRQTMGRVDLIFGNHRRWRLFPPQFITTSVPQNLCYVPDSELCVPQTIMLTPEELIDIGEVMSARYLLPYAMGNAPWFAEIGLGPHDDQNAQSGAFDGPLEEVAAADPDTLVSPDACLVALAPGDQIGKEGRSRDLSLPPINAVAFAAKPRGLVLPYRAFAMGGIYDSGTVRDLLELTTLDPASYFVASYGFIEIGTSDAKAGVFVWELAERLVPRCVWSNWSTRPLTSGLFGDDPTWLDRFERCQRFATLWLRSPKLNVAELRPMIKDLTSMTSSAAIEGVANELLGMKLALTTFEAPARKGDVDNLRLPPAASTLVGEHGRAATASALLLVKFIHGLALTLSALGHAEPEREARLFVDLLGTDTQQSISG